LQRASDMDTQTLIQPRPISARRLPGHPHAQIILVILPDPN
jgi:hypothetical protein